MMLAFLARHPPRTRVSHLQTVAYDTGKSLAIYKPVTDRFLVINRLPPAPRNADGTASTQSNSALGPPPHWHRYQAETFHVLEGKARFIIEGQERIQMAGEVVNIPAQQVHTFRNASGDKDLLLEFVLEPKNRERDEAFLRNVQTYREDCQKAGIPRSLPQVLLFNHTGNVVLPLPGPSWLSRPLGILLNFFGGVVIGRWLLGFKGSYPEYCDLKRG